jgi:hypothetical protein
VCAFEHIRALALGTLLLASSACYTYSAVPATGAAVGERVRVRISGAEAERLESVLGMTDRELEGELLEQSDSSLAVAVPLPLPIAGGGVAERAHQRIVIPRSDVQEIELRHLDKMRTTLLVGIGIAGVATAVAASTGAIQLGSGGSRGNPNESKLPPLLPLLKLIVRLR